MNKSIKSFYAIETLWVTFNASDMFDPILSFCFHVLLYTRYQIGGTVFFLSIKLCTGTGTRYRENGTYLVYPVF